MNKKELFELLKELKNVRKAKSLTIQELSEKSGVSVGVISELESDKEDKKVPSLLNFILLARTLSLSNDYVLKLILGTSSKNIFLSEVLKQGGIYKEDDIKFVLNTVEYVKSK